MNYVKTAVFAIFLLGGLSTAGCSIGGPSKPLNFYSFEGVNDHADSNESNGDSNGINGVTVAVKPFQASDLYQKTPIIWRTKRHMKRFQFSRWANSPPDMFRNLVADFLRAEAGTTIGWVAHTPTDRTEAPYAVLGTVQHLYLTRTEKNGENHWQGVVSVRLRLVETAERTNEPDASGNRFTPGESWTPLGTWTLHATGAAPAPEGEEQTPRSMNNLLDEWTKNLNQEGRKIARQIRTVIKNTKSGGQQKPKPSDAEKK